MWYFSWILGTAFAASFGILNAMWFEVEPEKVEPEKVKTCSGSCGNSCKNK